MGRRSRIFWEKVDRAILTVSLAAALVIGLLAIKSVPDYLEARAAEAIEAEGAQAGPQQTAQ